MTYQPSKLAASTATEERRPVKSGEDLKRHLTAYFEHLDANPIRGTKTVDPATGQAVYEIHDHPGTAVGFFRLYLGLTTKDITSVWRQHKEEFQCCLDAIRKRLLEKAVNKDLARLVAARPFLDLKFK